MFPTTQTQNVVSFDEIKSDIIHALKSEREFNDEHYNGFAFSSLTDARLLLYVYNDDLERQHLVINIAIPDAVYPPKDREKLLEFMKNKVKPVIVKIAQLDAVFKASQNNNEVHIYLRRQSEFDILSQKMNSND